MGTQTTSRVKLVQILGTSIVEGSVKNEFIHGLVGVHLNASNQGTNIAGHPIYLTLNVALHRFKIEEIKWSALVSISQK